MIKPKPVFIALTLLALTLGGGMLAYTSPPVLIVFIFGSAVLMALALPIVVIYRSSPPALLPWLVVLAAAAISGLNNMDIVSAWASRLYLGFTAAAVLLFSAALLTFDDITAGLRLAGLAWPGVFIAARLLGWNDHQNILAFYPVVFLLVGLAGRHKGLVIIHLLLLAYFTSRGAMLAAALGAAVLLWPLLQKHWRLYGLLALVGLVGLVAWKYGSALERLRYWQAALSAPSAAPWWGLGPGGLWARHIIPEPGGWQIHAHNIIITTLAETGWLGLLAGALAAAMLLTLRFTRLQAAIALGLAAWSMVDEPLFWPGPLLVSALIFSQLQKTPTPAPQK